MLNIQKLEELITHSGYLVNKYFTFENMCFFLELVSTKNGERFLLYIPSKYNFQVLENYSPYVYPVKQVTVNPGEEFASPNFYGNTPVELSAQKEENFDEHLESKYKQEIVLGDIMASDALELKSTLRQIKRLKFSIQTISYKIAIMYRNYLCVVRRDDTVECYYIKGYPRDNMNRRFMIVSDLEIFYSKGDIMLEEIVEVRDQICALLERNQDMHVQVVDIMSEGKKIISKVSGSFFEMKTQYNDYINRLMTALHRLTIGEESVITKLNELSSQKTNADAKGIYSDMELSKKRQHLEEELKKIIELKQKSITTLVAVREKREDAILTIDKALFDMNTQLHHLQKSIKQLSSYVE